MNIWNEDEIVPHRVVSSAILSFLLPSLFRQKSGAGVSFSTQRIMKAVNIRLENISKTFEHKVKGEVTAVSNVNLEIGAGELLTL